MGEVIAIESRKLEESLASKVLLEGIEKLKSLSKKLESILEMKNNLQNLSEEIMGLVPEVFGPMFQKALQLKADAMPDIAQCPYCDGEGKTKRSFPRKLDTRHGVIEVQRKYHECSSCGKGFFPFDIGFDVLNDRKQADVQILASDLCSELPYKTASALFKRATGLTFSDRAMHDQMCSMGELIEVKDIMPKAEEIEEKIAAQTNPGQWTPVLVVSADGAHVPTRPESEGRNSKRGAGEWKEAKGFRIFLAAHDRIIQIMSYHQIFNEESFGIALEEASKLIPQDQVRIALIGDGASWVWKHLTRCFPKGQEILDYYHCKEHIFKVANIHYSQDESQKQAWVESTMGRLFFGEVDSVIWGLKRMKPSSDNDKKEIETLITYLSKQKGRINYQKAKRRQFPIGSGGIESSNKAICHTRLKRSGAWWKVKNANTILAIRSAKENGLFERLFETLSKRRVMKKQ